MKKSWKTTTSGIIGIVTVVLAAVQAMVDENPATNPDWSSVIASVLMGVGLITARDNNVTSEDAGIKPVEPAK